MISEFVLRKLWRMYLETEAALELEYGGAYDVDKVLCNIPTEEIIEFVQSFGSRSEQLKELYEKPETEVNT